MAIDDKLINLADLKVSHDDLDNKVNDLKSDLDYNTNATSDITTVLGKEFLKSFNPVLSLDGSESAEPLIFDNAYYKG